MVDGIKTSFTYENTNIKIQNSDKSKKTENSQLSPEQNEASVILNLNSEKANAATYQKPTNAYYTMNSQLIEQLKNDSDKAYQSLKNLVQDLIKRQGKAINSLDSGSINISQTNITINNINSEFNSNSTGKHSSNNSQISISENSIIIDDQARSEANQLISEDGELGVKKTAERILSFAKAISGGDKSAIDNLKQAVKDGFEEVKKIFGGKLPDISNQTFDEIMKGFDEWEKGN